MAATKSSPPIRFSALKERREELSRIEGQRLTQEDIAARSGDALSQRTVSHLEAGSIELGSLAANRLTALARALKWTLNDLQEATGIDLGLEQEPVVPSSRALSAASKYGKIPRPTIEIPDALKEAAELYGHLPMYAGIRERRWQHFMVSVSRKATPQDAEGWLREFSDLKRMDYDPEEPE